MRLFLLFVFSLITTFANSQDLKIAMTTEFDCSQFYNGIATIQVYEDGHKFYFINRKGEKIEAAPGMLKWANDKNKIFENYIGKKKYNHTFLTNSKNKKVSKEYGSIKYISEKLFCATSFNGKEHEYNLIDNKGKVIWNTGSKSLLYYSHDDTPYAIAGTGFGDFRLYKGAELAMKDVCIYEHTLSPSFPIIEGGENVYVKSTGKIIKKTRRMAKTQVQPFTNCFIIGGCYYDLNGQSISKESLMTSSKGVTVKELANNKYALFDKNGNRINNDIYDDVDKFYWQSDKLAISKNGKWGYLNADGSIFCKFDFDNAGTYISGHAIVIIDRTAYAIDFNKWKKFQLANEVKSIEYNFDFVNSDFMVYYNYYNKGTKYGYYNLTKEAGWNEFSSEIIFKDRYIVVDNSIYFQDKRHKILLPKTAINIRSINEGLFTCVIYNDKHQCYYSHIYDINGNKLFDGEPYLISISGDFVNGVAPFFASGGIPIQGETFNHTNGYLYNTFSSTLDNVITTYGSMGKDNKTNELYLTERAQKLEYLQLLGNNALRNNRIEDAIMYYDKALYLYSVFDEVLFSKATALMQLGKYQEALYSLECANVPGVDFAKAVCHYHLGNFNAALNSCKKIQPYDPGYEEAKEIHEWATKGIRIKKEEKRKRNIAVLNAISSALNLFSQTMTAINSNSQSYSKPLKTYTPNNSPTRTAKQHPCSFCNGTGMNPAKERPSFYNYSEELYDNNPCDVCGSRENHYHKTCPSCGGKGYQIKAF